MNRTIGMAAAAVGLLGAGAITATLVAPGVANGASTAAAPKPSTFTMYANVDAEGDLGSHSGAVSAGKFPGAPVFFVRFAKPIGSCAAAAQIGKAGGPDPVSFASVLVTPKGTREFEVQFGVTHDNGSYNRYPEPFMITVTCKN